MKLAFLIGAGVSTVAGIPCTRDITERVLSAEGVAKHTNDTFYFGPSLFGHVGIPDNDTNRVKEFIKLLSSEANEYARSSGFPSPNHEDLFELATQIQDYLFREFWVPTARDFVNRISDRSTEIRIPRPNDDHEGIMSLGPLARECCNYIADITWHMVAKRVESRQVHEVIIEACREAKEVSIFTLNYDTLLEQSLKKHTIAFETGFGPFDGHARYWSPSILAQTRYKIELIKLHGSISWFFLESEKFGGRVAWVENSPFGVPDSEGKAQYSNPDRPLILLGGIHKILRYNSGIFAYLNAHFWNSLYFLDTLIVSGYSFRDRGINNRLIEWEFLNNSNRIMIIDPNVEKLSESVLPAAGRMIQRLREKGRLIELNAGFEAVSWEQIKTEISRM